MKKQIMSLMKRYARELKEDVTNAIDNNLEERCEELCGAALSYADAQYQLTCNDGEFSYDRYVSALAWSVDQKITGILGTPSQYYGGEYNNFLFAVCDKEMSK